MTVEIEVKDQPGRIVIMGLDVSTPTCNRNTANPATKDVVANATLTPPIQGAAPTAVMATLYSNGMAGAPQAMTQVGLTNVWTKTFLMQPPAVFAVRVEVTWTVPPLIERFNSLPSNCS